MLELLEQNGWACVVKGKGNTAKTYQGEGEKVWNIRPGDISVNQLYLLAELIIGALI